MSIFDDRPPNAPDSPQGWALSSALLRLDGYSEDRNLSDPDVWAATTEEVFDGLIGVDESTWAAQQRTFKVLGVKTAEDILTHMDEIVPLVAAWMDGFVAAMAAHEDLRDLKERQEAGDE